MSVSVCVCARIQQAERNGVDLKDIVHAGFRQVHAMFNHNERLGLIRIAARELTIEAAQSAGSGRISASRSAARELSFSQTKKLLDSRNDREILEGLRKVISVRNTKRTLKEARLI